MQTDADVIVVGGGLAGLTAAAAARRSGASVMVLEAHQPGGRARCIDRDGFTLNMGAHALYIGGPGAKVLAAYGVTPVGVAPPLRHYRALASGRQHVLPTGPASLLRTGLLGPRSKAQLARMFAVLPRLRPADVSAQSTAAWLRGRRLRPDVEAVTRALIRLSTYTADLDELSADAAIAQMQIAAKGGVRYLHGGWRQLIESLAEGLDVRSGVDVGGVDVTAGGVQVDSREGTLRARRVVLATGGPAAISRLLPADPGWVDLGPPVTAACLDLGVRQVPNPGYVLSIDEPLYVNVQSPPAHQAPDGQAVVAAVRYGARSAELDRPQLESHVREAGVRTEDVAVSRYLAVMTVAGTHPRAVTGGLAGRPGVADTGVPGVLMAGDWVGPRGLLSDASFASGEAAGLLAGRERSGAPKMVG